MWLERRATSHMAGRRGDWKNVRSLFRVAIDPPSDLMIWSFLDEAKPPYHSNSDKVRAFRCLCWTNVATQTPCPSFSAAKITISELVLSSSVVGATHEVSVFLPKTRSCPIPSQILAPQRRGKGLVAWFALTKNPGPDRAWVFLAVRGKGKGGGYRH